MANEIKTLYSDSAKTNAIYPRTKQNAISDADGNTMGNVGFYNATDVTTTTQPVYIVAQPMGIDTTKILFNASATSYTATEPSFAFIDSASDSGITLNGVSIRPSGMRYDSINPLPLLTNDVIAVGGSAVPIKVFGIKYGGNN